MKSKICVHVVDPDINRRAAVSYSLQARNFHTEIYEGFWELIDRFPERGAILANDNLESDEALELVDYVQIKGPQLPIALFSASPSTARVVQALSHGALSYLNWPSEGDDLEGVIEDIVRRSERGRGKASRVKQAREAVSRLSPREHEVLEALVNGCSSKKIGKLLNISPRTVEIHRSNMLTKLNAVSSPDAVRIGVYAGLDERAFARRN